jgi:hypothetical protein
MVINFDVNGRNSIKQVTPAAAAAGLYSDTAEAINIKII